MAVYTIKHKRILKIATILLLLLMMGCATNDRKKDETVSELKPQEKESETAQSENKDPLGLSFSDNTYHFDSELRNILSTSRLEYCSYVEKFEEDNRILLTWNLKSDGREVYRCDYTYDKNRKDGMPSMASCRIGEAYEEYLDGDRALVRDYVMPEKDDGIDMFVYPGSAKYYEKYFILGKYSDMYCYTEGDDIFFEYCWYQDTGSNLELVYRSTAVNYETTSGQRYNDELWALFEESCRNINIIPYDRYPRDKDYYEVYSQWRNRQKENKEEERVKEDKEKYCVFEDGGELYHEYEYEFDSYEDAADFLERYCN